MPDVSILYATPDQQVAYFMRDHLTYEGMVVFSAPIHLSPKDREDSPLLYNLNSSLFVVVLASSETCNQSISHPEIIAFLNQARNLAIAVWDVQTEELPAWADTDLVIDFKNWALSDVQRRVNQIADWNGIDRRFCRMVAGAAGFSILAQSGKD
jgi:hypothetical protein